MKNSLFLALLVTSSLSFAQDINGLKVSVEGDRLTQMVNNFEITSQKEELRDRVLENILLTPFKDDFLSPLKIPLKDSEKLIPFVKSRMQNVYNYKDSNNYLSFGYGQIGEVASQEYGFCHGYTFVAYTLRFLLHFDPDYQFTNKSFYVQPNGEIKGETYLRLIESSFKNLRPVVIPGFRNLKEFSANPLVKKFLKIQVLKFWANANISYQRGVIPYFAALDVPMIDSAKHFEKAQSYLNKGILPIFYDIKGTEYLHVPVLLSLKINGDQTSYTALNPQGYYDQFVAHFLASERTFYIAPYFDKYIGTIITNLAYFYYKNKTFISR